MDRAEKRSVYKAEVTAFLSIVFILLVSFVFGILEIMAVHNHKNMSRLTADRSIFSVFGEYQKELLEDYHIFAVDGSYAMEGFSEDRIISRMHYYENGNMLEHEVSSIQYLTDNGGQAFREQVIQYMEERYGISLIKEFTGLASEWEDQEIKGQEMEEQEKNILDEVEEIKSASEEADAENDSESSGSIEDMNPFTCLEQIEKSGILTLVLPEEMELSGLQISLEDQASNRSLQTGRGTFPSRQGMNGPEEKLLFGEYILKQFSNAAMDKGKTESGESENSETESEGINSADSDRSRSLKYEVEYIIAGKQSDKENLESVLMKIFLIRMALNYAYLFSDTSKQSEAASLAAVITSLLLVPQLSEALKQLILLAWAAGESVMDLRTLLSGKKAPLVKNTENWQLSLSSLFTLGKGSESNEGQDNEDGITYEGYLRAFLFLEDQENTAMRALDRIEENLDSEHGLNHVKADQCFSKLELNNKTSIFGEITYEFPVSFAYV